jgi:hypothetical protein
VDERGRASLLVKTLSCWHEPNNDFHDNTISHTECQIFFNVTEPAP